MIHLIRRQMGASDWTLEERQDAEAALDELLAVGERDREALDVLREWYDALVVRQDRDRRQIAQLTEVGKAAKVVAELNGEARSTYGRTVTQAEWRNALYLLETAVVGARAVLR